MERERLDLSPLDPTADPDRWERLIRSIRQRAEPELARRAAARSVLAVIGSFARPAMAAAAVLATLSTGVIAVSMGGQEPQLYDGPVLEEALRLSAPVSNWLIEARAPSTYDLVLAIEGAVP